MRILRATGFVAAAVAVAGLTVGLVAPASAASRQVAPGTPQRPVFSADEAAAYTAEQYFAASGPYAAPVADPWKPRTIKVDEVTPDFVVGASVGAGGATHTTVQTAVNAAFVAGGTDRRYIKILPGTYQGTVFIPAGGPPLTLYGTGEHTEVRLEARLDATWTPAAWAAAVNPSGQYQPGDPAWTMFNSCATKTTATVALCATVVWSEAVGLQLRGFTITNTLLDTVDKGTHQAVALRTDGDRTQVQQMRLVSRQDTFYVNAADPDRIARVFVKNSYIEGDTDFVFGRAAAVFDHTRFHLVSTRKPSGGVIFAPNTAPNFRYGFLVRRCRISADAGYLAAPTGRLGRAWDQGASATGYRPGSTPNGQLVIRESHIAAGFNTAAPWAPAATTSRPFSSRVDPDRDLDDVNHNRLWEYENVGKGA